jgi:hypothetical protein
MTTTINDDFECRVRCADYLRGIITVGYELRRCLGPRWQVAGVRLSYEGQYSLQFVSEVTWADGANYEAAVRHGILIALEERGRHSLGGKFTLTNVITHPIESSDLAFSFAGREATASILRLLKPNEASPVDGGIPPLPAFGGAFPAATDPHC